MNKLSSVDLISSTDYCYLLPLLERGPANGPCTVAKLPHRLWNFKSNRVFFRKLKESYLMFTDLVVEDKVLFTPRYTGKIFV